MVPERVAPLIAEPELTGGSLDRTIAEGEYYGMQSLDQALLQLARDGLVSLRDAMTAANDPTDLRLSLHAVGVSV